jgi:hypothetical protein
MPIIDPTAFNDAAPSNGAEEVGLGVLLDPEDAAAPAPVPVGYTAETVPLVGVYVAEAVAARAAARARMENCIFAEVVWIGFCGCRVKFGRG